MPKTKIICTLGPASSNATVLLRMMRAGMDVVRLNFSHGSLDGHRKNIELVRELNRKYRRHIRILGDLEGYRLRVGQMKGKKPVEVKKRGILYLTTKDILGEKDTVSFDYRGPLKSIRKGVHVYIDDGNIDLVVESVGRESLKTRAVVGGLIKEHKGINMPEVPLKFHGLAEHDVPNIRFCLEEKVDFIAQSFVRTPQDIRVLRQAMQGEKYQPKVIAKIENREGIHHIDGIMKVVDGIMIARGDMGVSLPIYEVPMIQKAIIRKCNNAKKFVITATQMLESMTENRLPTRAEVSDVANAILDGTDYVMLSAESAVGRDPAGCVEMMNKIIKYTEGHEKLRD